MAALPLAGGADIWAEDHRGRTPCHLARINADETMLALMRPSPAGGLPGGGEGLAAADWVARGHSLAVVGRYEQAVEAFRALLTIAPDDDQAWLNLGYCHERLDRPEDAVTPDLVEARYSLVVALRSLGRPEEAAPHYRWLKRGAAQTAAEPDSPSP